MDDKRADFSYPFKVAVHVHHTKSMMQSGLGDEEIGYRRAMPHTVVVREVALQPERPIKQIGRCSDNVERGVKIRFECVVVAGGSG